jgi:hypothetical protein
MASAACILESGPDVRAVGGAEQDAQTAWLVAEIEDQVAPLSDVEAARYVAPAHMYVAVWLLYSSGWFIFAKGSSVIDMTE